MEKRILFSIPLAVILSVVAQANAQGEMPNNKPKTAPSSETQTPPKIDRPGIPIYIPRTRIYTPPPVSTPAPVQQTMTAEQKIIATKAQTRHLINKLAPEITEVEIEHGHRAFTLEGKKGFYIDVPEYAFVDKEGNLVTGEVKMELTEYTSNADFAGAGLTCQTTEGFMLETGGMINLEAYSGKEKIQLAEGKSISIRIKDIPQGQGYREFYGVGSEQVSWSMRPPLQQKSVFDTSTLNGYTIVLSPTKYISKGSSVGFSFFSSGQTLASYVNARLKVPRDVKTSIKKSGIPFEYVIELNSLGKIKEVKTASPEVAENSLIAPIHEQIVKILKEAPALSMETENLYANTPYTLLFVTTGSADASLRLRKAVPDSLMPPREMERKGPVNEKSVSKDFSMNASGLSKINCDRFVTNNNPKDTVAFKFDKADAFVYVVFKDIRSLMMPAGAMGNYVLRNVPEGENVRYVAVIFNDKGEVKLGAVDSQISNSKIEFTNLQKYDEVVFKEMLNKW